MKKVKREKGFYKDLSAYLKLTNERRPKKMWAIEYWLKHTSDPKKDIRFYARFHYHSDIEKALNYMSSLSDENEYDDHTLLRLLDKPRTRRQKAILRSQLSSIPHISEIS